MKYIRTLLIASLLSGVPAAAQSSSGGSGGVTPTGAITGGYPLVNTNGATTYATKLPVSGGKDVRFYMATPYNPTPENEDIGLALKNACNAAITTSIDGSYVVDMSAVVPSGGWVGTGTNNYLYANTNPYYQKSATQNCDILWPDGPIITSVQWTTPSSGVNWRGWSHTGTQGGSSGTVLSTCNTAGGCGPNNYPQFMPAGAVSSIAVAANVATITMTDAADCPFTTGQIVMPTANVGTNGKALNGSSLTVLAPGCNGGASFTASFTAGNFTTESGQTGFVTATCANGGVNCYPIGGSDPFSNITPYSTGTITESNGNTTVTGSGTAWSTGVSQSIVGGVLVSDCVGSTTCTVGSSLTGWKLGRIVAVVSDTQLTLEAGISGGIPAGSNYFIEYPNHPVLYVDQVSGSSINNNSFGHSIDGVSFDCNGVLGCVGVISMGQERTNYTNLQFQNQGQQVAIAAPTHACAIFQQIGQIPIIGPIECDQNQNSGESGWAGGTEPWHANGFEVTGWGYYQQKINGGVTLFNPGTIEGSSGNSFYDSLWIDGSTHGQFSGPHCEFYTHRCVNVGALHPVLGIHLDGVNAINEQGASSIPVEINSGSVGSTFGQIDSLKVNNCMLQDDNKTIPCRATHSGVLQPEVFPGYTQTGSPNGTNEPYYNIDSLQVGQIAASNALPTGTTGIFNYGTMGFSDTGQIQAFQASTNGYIYNAIQNTNTGASASVCWLTANSNTTTNLGYGEFCQNGSGFTGTGALNQPNNVTFDSNGYDAVVGTYTGTSIHFVTNNAATDSETINGTGGTIFPFSGIASQAGVTVTGAPYTGGTATTNLPQFYLNADAAAPTTFSTAGTMFGENAPNGFTGNLMDFYLHGGASLARLDYLGNFKASGLLTLGAGPSVTPGTGSGAYGVNGTVPTGLGAGNSGWYGSSADSSLHVLNGATDVGPILGNTSAVGNNQILKTNNTVGQEVVSSIADNGTKVSTSEFLITGNTQRLTADATPITATTPGTVVFTWGALPVSSNWSFTCKIIYNQQSAAVAGDGIAVQGATNAPTRLDAWGKIDVTDPASTNYTGSAGSALNITNTTATSVVTATPGAVTTVYQAEVSGTIQVGASASTLNILMFTGNVSDSITPKAGSFCMLTP